MSSAIPLIPKIFIRIIEKWADKRLAIETSSASIDHRHLYILPTKNGLMFFFTLLIIFIGAVNYENNMAFLLCFILVSISLLSMFFTHQNINRLVLTTSSANAVFSGQTIYFPIQLKNNDCQNRFCIKIEGDKNKEITVDFLANMETYNILLPVKSLKRGQQKIPRIKIYSEYPLGLFYAWSWLKLSADCVIYPKPATNIPDIKQSDEHITEASKNKTTGHNDFDNLRDYNQGDSPNHIAWKIYARSETLYTKTFESHQHKNTIISWFSLNGDLNTEEKLAILCKQIISAHQQDLHYSLMLPKKMIRHSSGIIHRQQCLQALALFSI